MNIEKLAFWKTMVVLSALVAATSTTALAQTREPSNTPELGASIFDNGSWADSPAATQYLYWTNYQNGSVGRASTKGVNENFIPSITGGAMGGAGIA